MGGVARHDQQPRLKHTVPKVTTKAGQKPIAADLRARFVEVMDVLSALRQLLGVHDLQVSDGQLVATALGALTDHIVLSYCSVFLAEGDQLRCAAGTGFEEELARSAGRPIVVRFQDGEVPTLPITEGVMGLAATTGEVQHCTDCAVDERFRLIEGHHPDARHGSLLALPLKDGEEVLGVLNVWHHKAGFFEPWHRNAFALFADALALLLRNARLVRHLDLKVAMRTDALQRSLAESQRLRRRFEHLSSVDELTGLYNRRHFFSEARRHLQQAQEASATLVLVMLDLDNFKSINDTWGHAVGDDVLARVARVLAAELRAGDLLARLGGEEFVVLLHAIDQLEAIHFVERLRQRLAGVPAGPAGARRRLTASVGIAELSPDMTQLSPEHAVDVLYARADKAMYRCKVLGRNRWEVYQPADDQPPSSDGP